MCCPGAPRRGGPARDIFDQKTLQNSGKTSESGKTYYAANPKGPSGAPSAPRGHKSSPRAHVGNPWENKGKLRFRVVPLCRVRGGISGEGFPDSNELAAKFFGNQCFSHVLSIWGRSLAARGSHSGARSHFCERAFTFQVFGLAPKSQWSLRPLAFFGRDRAKETGQKRARSRSPGIRSFLAFALAKKGLRVIK